MKTIFKSQAAISPFWIILLFGFALINQAIAQEPPEKSLLTATKEVKDSTRIVISTSGPVKFTSYWLDNPYRVVIKFQSKNVISKIDNEVLLNLGIIKKISSSYFGRGQNRPLKSLTFELNQKVPYRIWQEYDAILLVIQAPLETSKFLPGEKELFIGNEVSDVMIKRLEAMDMALTQVVGGQGLLEVSEAEIAKDARGEIDEAKIETTLSKTKALSVANYLGVRKSMMGIVAWFTGLVLVSGLGFLVWRRFKSSKDKEHNKLESELQEKNKRLEQEEIIRKAMAKAALEKEKEIQQLKNSFGSVKDELIKKKLVKREMSPEEKERPWVRGKSQERRASAHLSLTKDFNKTIILRIESQNLPQSIKSFAKDISSGGLCFETTKEFEEKGPINFRLFFYGDQIPMIKIQAHIRWKKKEDSINYYGVNFDLIEEKDKLELEHYIDSKLGKATISEL
ncbi:MAG: PilZ domain-containing protein [Candidatus Omnitrophica bacterium]|nr:PilZ domain-containing protein [Candidatus Omnitrophota bacterium]